MDTSIVNNEQGLQAPTGSAKTRILLVDDEKSILSSLAQLLTHRYGEFLIGTAESAEEAMDIVRSTKVDVVVTDFRLPRMSGLELAQLVREVSPKTQSILITAYGADTVIYQAQQSGCVAYLEKPLDLGLLCQYIDKATDARHRFFFEGAQFSLPDVVQFYAMKKESVVLSVTAEEQIGMLAIERGLLVHAQLGTRVGLEALLELLEISGAALATICCGAPAQRTLSLTWFALSAASEAKTVEERVKLLTNQSKRTITAPPRAAAGATDGEAGEDSIAELIAKFKQKKNGAQVSRRERQATRTAAEKAAPSLQQDHRDEASAKDPDLTLVPDEKESDSSAERRRRQHVRELVAEGIKHFRGHRLDKARQAWMEAIKIDPECTPAKENLRILEDLLAYAAMKH